MEFSTIRRWTRASRRHIERRRCPRGGGNLRGRSRLRVHGAVQRAGVDAGLVVWLGRAEGALLARGHLRLRRRVPCRVDGQRTCRDAGRHRELRCPAPPSVWDRRDRRARWRHVRAQWPQVLAVESGMGRTGRERQHGDRPHGAHSGRHRGAVGHRGGAEHAGRDVHVH